MALGSHLITVRRFEKYIDDVIGKKANLPDTSKTIIGNISQLNRVSDETYTNLINPTAQTQTINGVTFTNNGDGTYTVNGKASADAVFNFASFTDFAVFENTKLVECPTGGSNTTFFAYIDCFNGSTFIKRYVDTGNGILVSDIPSQTNVIRLRIAVRNGYTANNLLFKPMLTTKLDATYDDYIPYSGSGALNENVAEMYEDISRINSDLTDKLNRSWTYIGSGINGANITFDLSNYNEVCLLIYTDVGNIQLAFTESFPIGFLSNSRILRGAGGYGSDLECYQMTISKNGLTDFHIFANGTENTSSSLVQVYAR